MRPNPNDFHSISPLRGTLNIECILRCLCLGCIADDDREEDRYLGAPLGDARDWTDTAVLRPNAVEYK